MALKKGAIVIHDNGANGHDILADLASFQGLQFHNNPSVPIACGILTWH